jgi:hypothetical protein
MVASEAARLAVTSAVYTVGTKTVYLISDPTLTVKLQAVDELADCGFAKPMTVALTSCEKPAGMPIPGSSKILLTCAGRSSVICDVDAETCGTVTADFGKLFNSTDKSFSKATAMPASEGGFVGDCLSDQVCFVMSEVQTVYVIGLDNMEISYVNFIDNIKDIRDWKIKRDLVMITDKMAFLSSSVVSSTSMTSIQSYPEPEGGQVFWTGSDPRFPDSNVGWSHGIAIFEKGLTWEYHDPETTCKYYTSSLEPDGPNVTSFDICGSRESCEAACTDDANCDGFTYAIGSYRCQFYSSCAMMDVSPDDPKITVKKEETAPCKTTVTGAVVPAEVTCPYASCDLNGDYIKKGTRVYRNAENTSILYADETQPCTGWTLALNQASPGAVVLLTSALRLQQRAQ